MQLRRALIALAAIASAPAGAVPMVFFEWNSTAVSPQAASILDSILRQAADLGAAQLRVSGHSDRSGSDAYNARLSLRRAQAVARYLASRGFAQSMIEVIGLGEARPLVETEDGIREPQNRYVLVEYLD